MSQIPNIYRIDKENRLLKGLAETNQIIERILTTSFKKLNLSREFKVENLKSISKDEITYYLYLYNSNEIVSDWEEFLPQALAADENFIQQKLSLILFIESSNDIFSVIGGNAYQVILPFIDQSYGLNTYSRIMKPNLDELLSIKSRGITGTRAGMSEQFRDNFRIIDFIKFGKIPQEIHLKLSQEISDLHFKFIKSKANERIQVFVGKAFKIKKDLDFEDLHKLISELTIISELAPSDYLSSYKEITNNELIEESLKTQLINKIYEDLSFVGKERLDTQKRFEFDFCNPNNIEKFYEADEYKLKEKTEDNGYAVFKTVNDRKEIYDAVLARGFERFGTEFFPFRSFIQGVRVTCYKDGKKTIGSGFLFHFSTEFSFKNNPIFLVDTKWYHLRDSFIEDLRINTQHVLRTYRAPETILDIAWNKQTISTEKKYNLMYNSKNNYIVLDTIITDGLELCDILYYDNSNLYLIHIKYGFNSKMRELTNQILISAKRLKDILASNNKNMLEKVYAQLIEKQHDINNLSLENFKDLFNKKITYILGFTSHLSQDIDVAQNLDKYDSNIARFSVVQCSSEMRSTYYDMLITQINRV